MKVQCYAIFDQCSGIYEKPFFSTADDLVKREFMDVAIDANSPIAKHPEHYSLWRLATFDNLNGKMSNEKNECLCTALEVISQSQTVDRSQMDMLHDKFNEPQED